MARSAFLVVAILAGLQGAFADPPTGKALPAKLPLSGRPPAKLVPDLCLLRYRISTDSPECQAHFDQGLAYFYSYVWDRAVQSFETATLHAPDCAMAWWGLSRAFDRAGKPDLALKALEKAREKQAQTSHREQLLITALLQFKKPVPRNATPEAKKRAEEAQRLAAIRTIDEMLSLYDDDEEAWFFRAQLAGTGVAAVPFYKALLRINPLHPGGTHDLVHYYDSVRRPALAWPYSENYIKGSPGIQHAYHMQVAHIATHLGRWDTIIERGGRAGESGLLTLALAHEGRFAEARNLPDRKSIHRFYLHLAERNWNDARQVIDAQPDKDGHTRKYLTALLYLKQARPDLAEPAVEALRQTLDKLPEKNPKQDRRQVELRLWETQGQLLCQHGDTQAGLALLAQVMERTRESMFQMGWGLGAHYMEVWGIAALKSGQDQVAELAFLEALTHDGRSVRGALGMQVLRERQGRNEDARRFADRARRIWQRADPGALDAELAYLRQRYPAKAGAEKPKVP
jgi:tetratricopeptide (TPR) repeat protein